MDREQDIAMNKEPWMAVCLSGLWPGIGQIYAGRTGRGIAFVVAELLLGVVGLWQATARTGSLLLAVILFIVAGVLGFISYFDAHRCARIANTSAFEEDRKRSKDPWMAVFLSFIIPGIGHMYARRWIIGIILLVVSVAGSFALGLVVRSWSNWMAASLFVESIAAIYGLFVCYNAYSLSPVKRDMPGRTIKAFFGFLLIMSLLESSASPLIKGYAVHAFKIPTGAMQPTLYGIHGHEMSPDEPKQPGIWRWLVSGEWYMEVRATTSGPIEGPRMDTSGGFRMIYSIGGQRYALPRFARPSFSAGDQVSAGDVLWSGVTVAGDHVLCDRFSYLIGKPERGDIIVFRTDGIPSCPPGTFYVKRLVGLPGDKISIQAPHVVINGEKLVDPPIFKKIAEGQDGYEPFCLPAGSFPGTLLSSPDDVLELGEGEYFVLGDNTRNSKDSRYFGPVPGKNIFGRVTKIYWPFSRSGVVE